MRQGASTVGALTDFFCPACHYKATVAGGSTRGWTTGFTTNVCVDCHELVDVVTWRSGKKGERPVPHRCPKCDGKNLVPWPPRPEQLSKGLLEDLMQEQFQPSDFPCPQCGAQMKTTGFRLVD